LQGGGYATSLEAAMARMNRLTDLKIKKAKAPGMYADGGGLYLQLTKGGDGVNKSWIFRYSALNERAGKRRTREMGLGPLHTVTLAEAREKARQARHLRLDGIDPIEAKRAARAQAQLDAAKAMTFKQCADAYIASHRAGWRNAKHAGQWETTLATHAEAIGKLPVQAIDTALVMKVIEPLWRTRPETASRLRGRIESVLDWASTRGYRAAGENPARWKGHLSNLLPARSKVRKVKHHRAMPYAALPSFLAALRERQGVASRALEFLILTAGRAGEVLGARWSEFDLAEKVWTMPAQRMKSGREHRVPLAPRALVILQEMQAHHRGDDGLVFPGKREGRRLSNSAILAVLKAMDREVTAHGFRSSFRDYAAEKTSFPREVAEAALAHAVPDAVVASYMRTNFFDRRRQLMTAWASYCAQPAPTARGKVVSLKGRG
jgi:integrase